MTAAPDIREAASAASGERRAPRQRPVRSALARGAAIAPEFTHGLPATVAGSLVATAGRIVVPIAVQQTVDRGLTGSGGARPEFVWAMAGACLLAVVLTGVVAYWTNLRIFRATESGLATLRTATFRHVHDLSVLTQSTERRGSLVSRVTSDVDTISTFVQWGGLLLVNASAQILVATVLMVFYSWQLTLLVWLSFLPVFALVRLLQPRVAGAFGDVRSRVGDMLSAISESVVGADTIAAHGLAARTQRRVDSAIDDHRRAAVRAQRLVASSFTAGAAMSGLVVAAVVVTGTAIGVDGDLTLGRLLAFLFLVQLFTGPVQMGTEVLNELQNALAGWRRVVAVLDTPVDVADPGDGGQDLPRRPVEVRFEGVRFSYTAGVPVLDGVDFVLPAGCRAAVVGETGSGKTTVVKMLTRLLDPQEGRVLLSGVDLRDIRFASLRRRVVLVPQEGFLLDDTVLGNLRWGRDDVGPPEVEAAMEALGLWEWRERLPAGLDTPVGPGGAMMSAGERQLLALVRAYLADPDLLVLDEATSSVDPATEARLHQALHALTEGRTSVTVAHRLSTAASADLVVVVDAGRVRAVAPHAELLASDPTYQRLHASWVRQQQDGAPTAGSPRGMAPAASDPGSEPAAGSPRPGEE